MPKIGLLPLYLELYDLAMPEVRERMSAFRDVIAQELKKRGLDVSVAPICRLKPEFEQAVSDFERNGIDMIVTLHLAYSPSLESADALASTRLPIVVLDTTPTYDYGPTQNPDELMYNHGIHGVQDMCNLLIRNGKPFHIEAGHWEESDVLDRVAAWATPAKMAKAMRGARVGRIGESFKGMGDFAMEPEVLRETIGITTIQCSADDLKPYMESVQPAEAEEERKADLDQFTTHDLDAEAHLRSLKAGLAMRKWIERESLTAFTMNFLAFTQASGVPVVPFLEASKAMGRGIGYAGEGDVLTAALVGALASAYPETSFTEMFCPDWKGGSIYLSHMGEMNINLSADKTVLVEKPFPWTDADNPVMAIGMFKPGIAVLVNLAPISGDSFNLTMSPIEMLGVHGEDRMRDSINGWFKPALPVADFLAEYSRAGGTHHCALVYGNVTEDICRFGRMMGWNVVTLGTGSF